MNSATERFTEITTLRATGRVSRRGLLAGAARLTVGGTLATVLERAALGGAAAEGTPVGAASYPELKVTVVDDPATGQAFKVETTAIPSGYVLLTAVNQSKAESSVGLVGPRPGQTMRDLLQLAATPESGNGFPTFFAQAAVPGGTFVQAGAAAQAVIHLSAGDWALWGGGQTANPAPVFITATGGGATQGEPPASIMVTEVDFAFGGLDVVVPAGKQTWKVVNAGSQPHMFSLAQVPSGTTVAKILASLNAGPNATPAAGGLSPSDFKDIGGVILQSPGATVWPLLDLPTGRYAATCFMTDPRNGEPHAMEGMVAVFDVGPTAG